MRATLLLWALAAGGPEGPLPHAPPPDVGVPMRLPPATEVALRVVEGVGATLASVRLEVDPSLTQAEGDAVRAALRRSGLVDVDPDAAAVLVVRRISDAEVEAEAVSAAGTAVWMGRVAWPAAGPQPDPPASEGSPHPPPGGPAEAPSPEPAAEAPRATLTIETVADTRWAVPMVTGAGYGRESGLSGLGHGTRPEPIRDVDLSWRILRDGEVIDELELAQMLGDADLVAAIEERRRDARLRWGLGFGAGALVGLALGPTLAWGIAPPDPATGETLQTVGLSLLVLGAASGVIALFFPTVDGEPVLDRREAERRVEDYNRLSSPGRPPG